MLQFPVGSLRVYPFSHGETAVPCWFPQSVSILPWGNSSSLLVPSECIYSPMGKQQFPVCSLRVYPFSHGETAVPCLFPQSVSILPWGNSSSLFVPPECIHSPMGTQHFPACSLRLCPWGPNSSVLVPWECVHFPMRTKQFPVCP